MAIRSRILAGVDRAFIQLQDLVVDVTLTQSGSSSYDFSTNSTVPSATSTSTVRGILLTESKSSTDGNRVSKTLILRSADVSDIDVYDSFTTGGKTYRMESYTDNGFIIEITVSGADNG